MLPESGNLGDLTNRSRDLDAPALIDAADFSKPTVISHGQLDQRANAVARALVAKGHTVGPISRRRHLHVLAKSISFRHYSPSDPIPYSQGYDIFSTRR